MIVGGKVYSVGGTSASSPVRTSLCSAPPDGNFNPIDQTFASVISLLNDARIAAKLPTLGFLNPWLYSQGYKGLNDIVTGSNPGCGTPGFQAVSGWDPVTGLGTPNFGLLKDLTLNPATAGGSAKKRNTDEMGAQDF